MDSNPVRVSTRAYFDVFSICLTIMVLGISLGGVGLLVQAVSGEELAISMLWFGLLGYASVLLLAYFLLTIFLHPSLLNVEIDPNQTAGGDFIGYESFGLKLILQGVVFLPTVLVVCGLVLAGTVGTEDMVFLEHGMLYILAGLLYPMIAYFVHLLLNLPLEVLHNILSIRASRPHVVSPGMERSPVGASGENLIEELRSLGSEFGATDSSPDGG